MTSLTLYATLTAAASDAEPRVAEGLIAPYGQPGRTSVGLKRIAPGALRMVAGAPVIGLYGHRTPGVEPRGVSRLIAAEDRPEGLWGRLRVAETPDGDLLLAELRGGVREGLSVELSDVQYDAADPDLVTSARLDAVAHVPLPAYDSARVTALAATLNTQGDPSVTAPVVPAPAAPVEPAAPVAPALDYTLLAAALAPHLTAAAVPGGLPTGALTAAPVSPGLAPSAPATPDQADPVTRAATLQAAVYRGEATPGLLAELTDITNTGLSIFQAPTGTLGEKLWEGASYTRRFVSLMRQKPLTSWEFRGWRWTVRPAMADYDGDKAEVPSGPVKAESIKGTAERLAGAWDIDRKFVDFGDAEFWTELYGATTESYLEESDLRAAAALVDYAIDVTGDGTAWPKHNDGSAAYALPQGYSSGAGGVVVAQQGVLEAAALATAILEDTPRVRQAPDYLVMNTADWLELSKLTALDLPAFLALLKVKPEGFQRSALVPRGRVVAGCINGATYRELGSTPIRVQALNIAQGGVDEGVFGYTGISMDKPGAIISVPLVEAG